MKEKKEITEMKNRTAGELPGMETGRKKKAAGKIHLRTAAAVLAALSLWAVFASALFLYTRPIEDRSYNLSLFWEGEAIPDDWVYDQKGWTVFTQEKEKITPLTPDGYGGFTGLTFPGQTFYYSRILTEDMDSPTLRLDTGDYLVAVFLDDMLLYTDSPESGTTMGEILLPMASWSRESPLIITLPQGFHGKTLTIAQSTLEIPETERGTVWPCSVTLYNGYTYESRIIAESFKTAIPASLAFAAGTALLLLFLWRMRESAPDMGTLFGALPAFFWLMRWLSGTPFSLYYFSFLPFETTFLWYNLSIAFLPALMAGHVSGRPRTLLWFFTAAQAVVTLVDLVFQAANGYGLQAVTDTAFIGIAALVAVMVCGFLEYKKGSWFCGCFCLAAGAGAALWVLSLVFSSFTGISLDSLPLDGEGHMIPNPQNYVLYRMAFLMSFSYLIATGADAVRKEILSRAETRLLAQRIELSQSAYEAMRLQHEQVMMLRHDMAKHFRLLRQMTEDEKTARYLDELMRQNQTIRPVIQSGNEMLDIILNAKLQTVFDEGVKVELLKCQAPGIFPLPDANLCSLIMNLLDNALESALATARDQRYIKLDMHIKNQFFVFICENSATAEHIGRQSSPGRGLGLKIVREIAEKYEILTKTEKGEGFYKVTLAIPFKSAA